MEVQTKKPKQHNKEHGEVLALIKAKCDEHVITLGIVDPLGMFKIVVVK